MKIPSLIVLDGIISQNAKWISRGQMWIIIVAESFVVWGLMALAAWAIM